MKVTQWFQDLFRRSKQKWKLFSVSVSSSNKIDFLQSQNEDFGNYISIFGESRNHTKGYTQKHIWATGKMWKSGNAATNRSHISFQDNPHFYPGSALVCFFRARTIFCMIPHFIVLSLFVLRHKYMSPIIQEIWLNFEFLSKFPTGSFFALQTSV